jgi:hypothetical protein
MTTEMMTSNLAYATREQWINAFIDASRPYFDAAGMPLPINIRAGVGFPIEGYRSKNIGQIIYPEGSADRHYEIFLNPITKGSEAGLPDSRMADILTHELCHAACDYNKAFRDHGRANSAFGQLAKAMGLEGSLDATIGGAGWHAWADSIMYELGPMPYAHIDLSSQYKKKETTLKSITCPDCGWQAWANKKHILNHDFLNCPTPDCGGILTAKL